MKTMKIMQTMLTMKKTCAPLLMVFCLAMIVCPACEKKQQSAGDSNGTSDRTTTEAQDAETQPPSPTAAAEAAIEVPEPESEYKEQGGVYAPLDYLSFLMKQPAQAKTVVAQMNMRTLAQQITLHKVKNGDGFPKSLEAMVESGDLSPKLLTSAGNPNAQIVYLRPTDRPDRNALLAFDPVGYTGGKYFIVTCGGASKSVKLDELKAAIRDRQGKVVQPKLTMKK